MQTRKTRRTGTRRFRKAGWKRIKAELAQISPHLEEALREGKHVPEGWGRFKDGELIEAIYVDYNPETGRWTVNHYPTGDVIDIAGTKGEAMALAKVEVEFRVDAEEWEKELEKL